MKSLLAFLSSWLLWVVWGAIIAVLMSMDWRGGKHGK
jgi:hypothetical protein